MNKKDKKNKLHQRKFRISDETKIYGQDDFYINDKYGYKYGEGYDEVYKKDYKRERKSRDTQSSFLSKMRIDIKKVFAVLIIIIVFFAISFGVKAHSWKSIVTEMEKQQNSEILDKNNKTVAVLGKEKKKIYKEYDIIPQDLKDAYVAIEDERFYKHGGIDLKRTGGAIISYVTHFGKSSYGGSTITQQLVKNITGDSKSTIGRKITEWFRAWQTETFLSKDEVLGFYLNIIYTGPNIYGVGAAANYYFNERVENLDLAECAFLAGINNSPNSYNPFEGDKTQKIEKRTKLVLDKMKELNYITDSEYNEAIKEVEDGLEFEKCEIDSEDGVYSYHSDATYNEVIADIAKKYNMSETFATNYIEMAGLKIYSTVDSNIQNELENECEKSKYIITSNGEKSQAAMVIMEPSTGYVVGCVGGLGEKTKSRPLNRATQSIRQTGSSIKPLSVLVPGINKNIINASTICDDNQIDFGNGYAPRDFGRSLGKVTVRRALESSQNIPFVEIMQKITPSKSASYLRKMGITSLTKNDESLGLALGGLERGITPLQMAGAYNTIANDGKYIEPTFYTSVIDGKNRTVVKTKQKKRRVFSKSVAFVIKELLTQPVEGTYGTATYCKISGVDVAAKTGTTDEDYDKWLCGFTPYYTATCWFGYDQNQTIHFNNRNPAGLIWANVMSRIHSGKKSARFEMPTGIFDNVVSYKVCAESGKLARSNCEHTYQEYYLKSNVPGYCDMHSGSEQSSITSTGGSTIVDEIIKEVTNEIDAVDPQEIEKDLEVIENIVTTTNKEKEEETNKNKEVNTTKTDTSSDKKENDKQTNKTKEETVTNTTTKPTTNTTTENKVEPKTENIVKNEVITNETV